MGKKENYKKFNAVLRYGHDAGTTKFNITAMGYGGNWNATDQIPLRAVRSGVISRLGAIDPSDGGEAHRTALAYRAPCNIPAIMAYRDGIFIRCILTLRYFQTLLIF